MQEIRKYVAISYLFVVASQCARAEAPPSDIETHYSDYDLVCVVELVGEVDPGKAKAVRWDCRLVRILKGEFRPELAKRVLKQTAPGGEKWPFRLVALKHSGSGMSSPIRVGPGGRHIVRTFSKAKGELVEIPIPGLGSEEGGRP